MRWVDVLELLQLLISDANRRILVFHLQIDIFAVVAPSEHCVGPETRLKNAFLIVSHLRVADSRRVVLLYQIFVSLHLANIYLGFFLP